MAIPLLVLPFFACAPADRSGTYVLPPDAAADLDASADASGTVGTVANVTWTTEEPGTSVVEFGPDEQYGYRTPGGTELVTDHRVVVAGMPAGAEWHWRAVSEIDGEVHVGPDNVVSATSAPAGLPEVTMTGEPTEGWTLVAWAGPPMVAEILDGEGRPCWWYVANDAAGILQTRLSRDGLAVLVPGVDPSTREGQIVRIPLDGSAITRIPTPGQHHDFLELPDGRIAYLASDPGEYDGEAYMGDAVMVVDPGTGESTEEWSTWDEIVPTDTEAMGRVATGEIDWTHANGLAWDGDTWYVSLRYLSEIAAVRDGARVWWVGGDDSPFTLTSGDPFAFQHAPTLTDDGFLLVSNGDKTASDPRSRAMGFSVDAPGRTWSQTWDYPLGEAVGLLGNVERVSDDELLVSLGDGNELRRVTADGDVTQRLTFPTSAFVSYAHAIPAFGGSP